MKKIVIRGAREHNLRQVDLDLNHGELIVFTGVSGSGKSSLVFDTLYVEGKRRYLESLSASMKAALGDLKRPNADVIEGLSPTIAVEQKSVSKSPRSTVGTITGIYDLIRVLFARCGTAYCPVSQERLAAQSEQSIIRAIQTGCAGKRVVFLTLFAEKKGSLKAEMSALLKKGFVRARIDQEIVSIADGAELNPDVTHRLEIVIDRLLISSENTNRLKEAVNTAISVGQGTFSVYQPDVDEEHLFSSSAYSQKSKISYPPLEPHDFSFNAPAGMCPACEGLGTAYDFDLDKIIDPDKSISEDCCAIAGSFNTVKWGNVYKGLAKHYKFSLTEPWKNLPDAAKRIFLEGSRKKYLTMTFTHPITKKRWTEYVRWHGVIYDARMRLSEAKSETYHKNMKKFMHIGTCSACQGARIKAYPAAARYAGKAIHAITQMPLKEAHAFFSACKPDPISAPLLKEINQRLSYLIEVGLHYLSLERTAPTLSGGEAQRVRLSSELGSGLSHATYILDEPSIGLHPIDNHKLIQALFRLREQNNTVLVVEHDEQTILSADTVVEIGPGAGIEGGQILYLGPPSDFKYDKPVVVNRRRKPKGQLVVQAAAHHNLKNIDVTIPLGVLTVVVGVSGSGKSSLILDTLHPFLANHLHRAELFVGKHRAIDGMDQIDKVIAIDQAPIGRTPRSNAATYIKLFDDIRQLFAKLPISKARGYGPGRFSFNVDEGSCPICNGMGEISIDMDFLEDAKKTCPECQGRRFDPKTLDITYNDKAIDEVLAMSIADALLFFENVPTIHRKLELLNKVGLHYLTLGQSATTLSGGEAQRVKLAKELVRPSTEKTLYILDEPTTGLHARDIQKLMEILHTLVDSGNSVIIIEHNQDVMESADYLIEMGPEGGEKGGEIIFAGTLRALKKAKTPTALALNTTIKPIKQRQKSEKETAIVLKGGSQHNLKEVSLEIPHDKITVFCGPSGSGKSSAAFDTIYAEGQRRYTETLPLHTRAFVKSSPKPQYESISGLLPAIAIEQKHHAGNPRSTVGTITEIYDYLRLIYAHAATPYCPDTGEKIESITEGFVCDQILALPEKTKIAILAPLNTTKIGTLETLKTLLQESGFTRIRLNDRFYHIDDDIPYHPKKKNTVAIVVDRLQIKPEIHARLFEAVEMAAKIGKQTLLVALPDRDLFFNLAFAVPSTGKSYPELIPQSFSYNSEEGMCPICQGLGFEHGADLHLEPAVLRQTPLELWSDLLKENLTQAACDLFETFLKKVQIDPDTPIQYLDEEQQKVLFLGSDNRFVFRKMSVQFLGFCKTLERLGSVGSRRIRRTLESILSKKVCTSCKGARLKPLSRCAMLQGMTLPKLVELPLNETWQFFQKLHLDQEELNQSLFEIIKRLQTLLELGLGYLSLFRSAPTLSGGETQRLYLARALTTGLTGSLYVFDEPTIGLSNTETQKLITALQKLAALGNTLLLVEHDPSVVKIADTVIAFGPGAGPLGGTITYTGNFAGIEKELTAKTPIPKKKRSGTHLITIEHASLHNLNDLCFSLHANTLTCITGVSGSGKSTLIQDLLAPALNAHLKLRERKGPFVFEGTTFTGLDHFKSLIHLDQNPLGQTRRADIASYTDISPPLRAFFATLPEAAARGLKPKHFSFNHLKGMCRTCWGIGEKTIKLQYLPSVTITCPACHGERLNPLSASVTYRGKSLGQLMNYTLKEALDLLPPLPKTNAILERLLAVGLDYLLLGQPIQTLSGGEGGRLRLARETAKRRRGHTLYLFDEPTIGLHPSDIDRLIPLFHTLIDSGHTVIIIEHNPHILDQADHLITLGPGAGRDGGHIL